MKCQNCEGQGVVAGRAYGRPEEGWDIEECPVCHGTGEVPLDPPSSNDEATAE